MEENSGLLEQKWTGTTSESFMHMIACITYYLSKVRWHLYICSNVYNVYLHKDEELNFSALEVLCIL